MESDGGRFWRAHDTVLDRHVAVHVIAQDDPRAQRLLEAARRSTMVVDRRVLRVLDAAIDGDVCYVVNEWGTGISLDVLVGHGPIDPRHAAWLVGQVAESVALAHDRGIAHGRLVPENVIVERGGGLRVIGLCVDAALHGLPYDRVGNDVRDLAGLLYCALTGSWAGASASVVRRAPSEQGQVLRPRRVRAGVPRPLDELCDTVLHPHVGSRRSLEEVSASGIARRLAQFVGEDHDVARVLAATLPPVRERFPTSLPSVAAVLPHDDGGGSAHHPTSTGVPTGPVAVPVEPPRPSAPVQDVATQAALPALAETPSGAQGEARTSGRPSVPAPAALPELPERPLFAPEPAAGAASRRSRALATPTATGTSGPASHGAPGTRGGDRGGSRATTTSSGLLPVVVEPVPGRRSLRLALVLIVVVTVLLGATIAFNLSRGRTPLGAEPAAPTPSPSASSAAPDPVPLTGLVASDLDPQGSDGAEHPEEVGLAVDGDPGTAWRTSLYYQQLGPGGLKTGVGLVVDLGATREVSAVDLTFLGAPTAATVYLSEQVPTAVAGLSPAGSTDGRPESEVALDAPTRARYVVVWLTALPAAAGGFQGQVADVGVLGA